MVEKHLSDFLTDEIARRAGLIERQNNADYLITGIEYDSRKIKPGNIYCALRGLHTDGHLFIDDAIARGAQAIILEEEIPSQPGTPVFLRVRDTRHALSPFSAAFYGFPSRHLFVIGVTGTEGKSTTVYLIWQLLRLMGQKAGFISTVQYSSGGDAQFNPEHQTTPEANIVQRIIGEMVENRVKYAVIEASSHGLSERTQRLGDVFFDAALMTTVTHEHMEFHGSWEQYRSDKANLFRSLDKKCIKTESNQHTPPLLLNRGKPVQPFGVINADDPSAAYFAQATRQRTVLFSTHGAKANLSLLSIEPGSRGSRYEVYVSESNEKLIIKDRLPGAYNAANVLASLLAVSGLTDIPIRDIAPKVAQLEPVRGRMTQIDRGQPFELVVDYAHTPSSFQTIFPPLRKRISGCGGKIISVFGSAGERDTQKRHEQGKIAAQYSDLIILTNEDPRGENPMDILEEIARGCFTDQACIAAQDCKTAEESERKRIFTRNENIFLIPDRCAAIRKALSLAQSQDLVLLLGKGHENSIIYRDGPIPFDEISEAEKALAEMGYGTGNSISAE